MTKDKVTFCDQTFVNFDFTSRTSYPALQTISLHFSNHLMKYVINCYSNTNKDKNEAFSSALFHWPNEKNAVIDKDKLALFY